MRTANEVRCCHGSLIVIICLFQLGTIATKCDKHDTVELTFWWHGSHHLPHALLSHLFRMSWCLIMAFHLSKQWNSNVLCWAEDPVVSPKLGWQGMGTLNAVLVTSRRGRAKSRASISALHIYSVGLSTDLSEWRYTFISNQWGERKSRAWHSRMV